MNKHYIENGLPIYNAEEYIEVLNEIPLKQNGFIYQNYCLGSGSKRNYFSDRNGQRIDTARQQIDYWRTRQNITDNLYYFLLSSLLESADKVANTACVYSAFLKHLKKSAQKPLVIKSTKLIDNVNSHKVYRKDACEFITETYGDILYLDPPYNNRQYGATYHLLNTIAQYREFNPKGVTGQRPYQKSTFCSKREAINSLESLVKKANFKYLFLSYNNEGIIPFEVIKRIMKKYGKYDIVLCKYPKFTTKKNANKEYVTEYLHILEKLR